MIQDYIITSMSILFFLMLIPQLVDVVRNKTRMNIFSCFSTGSGLLAVSICYFTLDLFFSFITTLLTAIVWLVLGVCSLEN